MPANPNRTSPWDFSNVYDLVNNLSGSTIEDCGSPSPRNRKSSSLGDFGPIWQFLDVPISAKHDIFSTLQLPPPLHEETYTSDGAAAYTASKNVTWSDELTVLEATEEPTSDSALETDPAPQDSTEEDRQEILKPSPSSLDIHEREQLKKERKAQKTTRKQETKRLKAEAAKKASIAKAERKAENKAKDEANRETRQKRIQRAQARQGLDAERKTRSDVESEAEIRILQRPSPAAKAGIHNTPPTLKDDPAIPRRYNLRSRDTNAGTPKVDSTPSKPSRAQSRYQKVFQSQENKITSNGNAPLPGPVVLAKSNKNLPLKPEHGNNLIPASVTPQVKHFESPKGPGIVHNNVPQYISALATPSNHGKNQFQILPKEDRDLHLFLRLIFDFKEDKRWLTKPVHLVDHLASPKGIHVFVDFSNIWVSFMDHLKELQLQMKQSIPHQNISFDSLVLLLERHRPVAKRVLAGSYPLLPAMELAKAVGYETNVLDKVYKAREMTEYQRRRQVRDALRRGYSAPMQLSTTMAPNNGSEYISSPGIRAPTTPLPIASSSTSIPLGFATPQTPQPQAQLQPQLQPEKWVEQGVDELLHLKMLESVIDADEPSIMVVATGDAAQAEYSGGFAAMIVRALKKGWKVELVAWRKSVSARYRDQEMQRWAVDGMFRIIELDGYAEFLLDT
ncbi:hypothetical protein EJ08DRAFT_222815 [Tothia fuscella]|uniref:NYN domain-containing protein n=1 Tax=Tothia fuscella TaxID=1048955 RepID=A0A9P4U4G1_9PEZI|nr:hypothetical protein EJ08DRAFT_222815 [Tothia fuscella]